MTDFNEVTPADEATAIPFDRTGANPFVVSTATIDVITRAAFKYRLISRKSADLLGSEMLRLNTMAVDVHNNNAIEALVFTEYTRNPFERKVKRTAIDGALRCWLAQVSGLLNIANSPAHKLVSAVKAKNDERLGLVTYGPDLYDEDGEFISRGERQIGTAVHDFWDIDADDEDILIRSREVRDAEAAAVLAARLAERRAANESSADDDDDDEDGWDDDDDPNY